MGYKLCLVHSGHVLVYVEHVESVLYSWPMLSVWVLTESIQLVVFLYTVSKGGETAVWDEDSGATDGGHWWSQTENYGKCSLPYSHTYLYLVLHLTLRSAVLVCVCVCVFSREILLSNLSPNYPHLNTISSPDNLADFLYAVYSSCPFKLCSKCAYILPLLFL